MRHASSPDDCRPCCTAWDVIARAHAAGESLTLADIAAAIDLAPRTTRVHLSVLVTAGHLDVDRRTPLHRPGRPTLPPAPPETPGRWAATVTLECGGCRRVLTVIAELAGPDWTTRGITRAELARHARMTPKTWTAHVGHLQAANLVRKEADPYRNPESGKWAGSRPDRYVLLSSLPPSELLTAPGRELLGRSWHEDQAHELLTDAAPWVMAGHVEPWDRQAAVERVAGHLRDGYPYAVLHRMITRRRIDPAHVRDAYALLIALLPPPGSPYVPALGDVLGTTGTTGRADCPVCERPHADPAIPPGVTCSACTRAMTPAF